MVNGEVFYESFDEGRISAAVLNRPAKRNAISPEVAAGLMTVLEKVLADRSHVFLLRSAVPGVFCAGFDINFIGTDQEQAGEAAMSACIAKIDAATKVTVAFADGFVFGGGNELFLSADLRLATPRTTFRITPARLGVVYSYRGLARFFRVMGTTATMEMLLAARTMTAEEALRVGLVTRIVADETAALDYCREVASLAPLSQQAMKAALKHLAETMVPDQEPADITSHLATLRKAAEQSNDRLEGKRAFMEKREPRFVGN
jgi:enoyl-CoA hydratase/carnithine racemase